MRANILFHACNVIIAALKCRQRKKQQLKELQSRIDWLAQDNDRVQQDYMRLREEAVYIRSLLQAYRECPIAQANGVVGLDRLPPGISGLPVPNSAMYRPPSRMPQPPPATRIPGPPVPGPSLISNPLADMNQATVLQPSNVSQSSDTASQPPPSSFVLPQFAAQSVIAPPSTMPTPIINQQTAQPPPSHMLALPPNHPTPSCSAVTAKTEMI